MAMGGGKRHCVLTLLEHETGTQSPRNSGSAREGRSGESVHASHRSPPPQVQTTTFDNGTPFHDHTLRNGALHSAEDTRISRIRGRLDFRIDFEDVAIWVSEKQCAMAEGTISWPRDDVYSSLCQRGRTTCHLTRSHPEGKLHGKCAYRQGRIGEPPTEFG